MNPRKSALDNTIPGVAKPSADFMRLVRRIQQKVITYGVCSASEEALLRRYTDYGDSARTQLK